VVRYLTLDPPDLGRAAQELIESDEALAIPVVAVVEAAYVLTRLYGVPRVAVVDLLVALIGRANLSIVELPKSQVVEALLLCRPSGRVSFADALIWATARLRGSSALYTFDHQFPAENVQRRVLPLSRHQRPHG
jgi:predicted nucleic acid-binding protein